MSADNIHSQNPKDVLITSGRSLAMEKAAIEHISVHSHIIDPNTNRRQYVITGQEMNVPGLMVAIEVETTEYDRHAHLYTEEPYGIQAQAEDGVGLPNIDINDPSTRLLINKLDENQPNPITGTRYHKISVTDSSGKQRLFFCGILRNRIDTSDISDNPSGQPIQINWFEVPDIFLK